MSSSAVKDTVLGISFDGLAISGIVCELLNVVQVFATIGYRALIDLGYDITFTADRNYHHLPDWAEPTSTIRGNLPADYTPETVQFARTLVKEGLPVTSNDLLRRIVKQLRIRILERLLEDQVRYLIVENGTLPDNPIFSEALRAAIDDYSAISGLTTFTLWRDHDLMWSAEPHLYGSYPYSGVTKPTPSRSIAYAVLTNWMRLRMRAWAPGPDYHVVPNRFHAIGARRRSRPGFRKFYSLPQETQIIARCTRVIPQKAIANDIYCLRELNSRSRSGEFALAITGPTIENPNEFERLCGLAKDLDVERLVIWLDGLEPFNPHIASIEGGSRYSVADLLSESLISSFLTSFDYEGFGNPPGEAMAANVPFVSTTYELYHEVYGSKGVVAPLLPIQRGYQPTPDLHPSFLKETERLTVDADFHRQVTQHNYHIYDRYFSIGNLRHQLLQIFPELTQMRKLIDLRELDGTESK